MNAQQLRNSILQEAIEGRLVPQDPNDEPASVLLDKIRAEKKRLVKEGKLKKKDLEVKPISEDEIPFEIPESWEWVRLVDIGIAETGTTPSKSHPEYFGTFIPFLGPANMLNGQIISETQGLSEIGADYGRIVPKGSILQVCIGGSIGKCAIVDKPVTFNQQINSITPLVCVIEFIYYVLQSDYFRLAIKDKSTGTATPIINRGNWEQLAIPLPPLAEQKRIVEKIEELLPKIDEYGKAQESLDKLNEELPERLRKSILQEAIEGRLVPQDPNDEPASVLLDKIRAEKKRLVKEGKLKKKDLEETPISEDEIPFDIPESWKYCKLSFITSLIDGEKREGDYVCLDAKYLRGKSTGEYLTKGKFVRTNDNIILVDGENSGEVFKVPCDGYMGSTFKQLWVSESIFLPYILYFIKFYKDVLRNSKKGAAIPHLNKEVFNNLIVGIPPLAEQKRIVEKVEQLLKEIDKLKQ